MAASIVIPAVPNEGMAAPEPTAATHPYTCLACALAFASAAVQRSHYLTDLHRYNSKRRVAGLNPVSATVFGDKVLQSRGHAGEGEGEVEVQGDGGRAEGPRRCDACGKGFASEGAERSHLASKKHREAVFKGAAKVISEAVEGKEPASGKEKKDVRMDEPPAPAPGAADGEALEALIRLRTEAAPRIPLASCLFCPASFPDADAKLSHMLKNHGFFLPDQEYLADLNGLMEYLAEGISVWNVCLYCGAGFGGRVEAGGSRQEQADMAKKGLERVRKHMCDKSHCKIAWNTEAQRLELSDYYDFRSSYPEHSRKFHKGKGKAPLGNADGWEDVSDEEMEAGSDKEAGIEVVMDTRSDSAEDDDDDDDEESLPAEEGMGYGDSLYELVLPSGRRIGHRHLRHIYRQNMVPYTVGGEATPEGSRNSNLIARLALTASASAASDGGAGTQTATRRQEQLNDRLALAAKKGSLAKGALVPAKGGLGAYGRGGEVVQARSKGEAKEAGRHVREHRDQKKAQDYRTRVGIKVGNNQKHYRDPLLQ